MNTNAILKVDFNETIYEFPVLWQDKDISDETNITERLFFSEEFAKHWNANEQPDMTVYLASNKNIKSRVNFEQEADCLYTTKNLSKLLA